MQGIWVAALRVMLPKYDVDQVLAAIKQYRPTYFPAVPTVFVSLLNHPRAKEFGLDKVRTFNSGGAPCPVEVIEQWERTFGRPLNEGYGLSETSPVTHTTPQLAIRKPGSIGIPVLDTDIKIVDVETGTRELPAGEAGELCISGPQVMKGYWRAGKQTVALRPDIRAACGSTPRHRADGRTGSSASFSARRTIIVDGFNVYPSQVETMIASSGRGKWR